jgi:multicomponent Na+:H+ antiporter subunit D
MIALPPAFIFLFGLLFVPILGGRTRKCWTLLVGAAGLMMVFLIGSGSPDLVVAIIPGIETILLTTDPMRQLAGILFTTAGFLVIIYASYRDLPRIETIGILASVAAALGVVYAGDLITVFVFWELLALASLAIIWSSTDPDSPGAGYRYLLFHIFGGACLLGGIVYIIATTGTAAIGAAGDGMGFLLLFIGIGVNAAFIPLHTWLPDAYPRSSVVGSVALCTFTTKAAVFLLAAIGGWGTAVAYMGGAMALYGAVYALMQDDIRRLLSYSIISQCGYMVAAIGVGTVAGIDAGLAHLVNDILFKSLLFMAAGAVILRTGSGRLSELGGLARTMPKTTVCAVIGGLALAGMPGLNGAVSKGMVFEAAGALPSLSFLLIISAVITVIYVARFLYLGFFRPVSGTKEGRLPEDAPTPMMIAMAATALLCIVIGLNPTLLTNLLPGMTAAHPFALSHLIESALIFAGAGVLLLIIRPLGRPWRGFETDIDWLYIRAGRSVVWIARNPLLHGAEGIGTRLEWIINSLRIVSANPPVACQIAVRSIALPFVRAFSDPSKTRAYEERLSHMKDQYPHEQISIWGGGYGIIFISIIAFLYFLFYMIE